MVSSRTAMKYGEIKPGDWERRRKEKKEEEERRHTAELFKRRLITSTSVGGLSLLVHQLPFLHPIIISVYQPRYSRWAQLVEEKRFGSQTYCVN